MIGLSNGYIYTHGFWLVIKVNGGVKKLHTQELPRNQSILRFDVILQHNWPIEQVNKITPFGNADSKKIYMIDNCSQLANQFNM